MSALDGDSARRILLALLVLFVIMLFFASLGDVIKILILVFLLLVLFGAYELMVGVEQLRDLADTHRMSPAVTADRTT
jgi:Ca2+/Na+ antiporter